MSISVSQINGTQLTQFIVAAVSGGVFSGVLGGFIAGGGYFGTGLLSTTGGNQNVVTNVTFLTNPTVPYSGGTGTSPSQQWVTDQTLYYINALSGTITGGFVTLPDNQTIGGYKQITGNLGLLTPPTIGVHAVNLNALSGVSGLLAAAGAGAVSGVLNTTIANTGQSAWNSANGAANTLSGLLTASGQALSAVKVTGSSVNNVVNFTGLGGTLVFTSGGFTFISGAAGGGGGGTVTQGQLDALSGALGASGSQLYNLVTGTSGQANLNFATIVNLSLTGSNLYVLLTGASGQLNTNHATVANLALTGSNLYQLVTGLSGQAVTDYATKANLALSGSNLYNLLTGESGSLTTRDLNISGALQAQIAGAVGTQVQVTGGGTMGFANLSGAGSVTVFSLGSLVTISGNSAAGGVSQGQLDALSGVVGTSGSQLYVIVTGLSGQVNTNFATITTTNTITTNLGSTGSVLYVDLTGMSGQSVTDYSTKMNLALTGSNLYIIVTGLSGQDVTNYATKTQLTSTGVTLGAQITSLSGFTVGASGALQAQIAAGGSQVRVSGSSNIAIADFTGIGGTIVFTSGSQVFISGGAGGSSTPAATNTQNTLSFYFDQYNLVTGLNQIEAFVARDFVFTGYALGVINTGTQGYFSGSLYQRTSINSKTNFVNFSLNSGMVFTGVGGYTQSISGLNRIGVDIFLIGTGITGLSIGVFGTGG